MNLVIVVVCLAAAAVQAPRWLRVAQREHYLAGSTLRFASRWWASTQLNLLLALAVLTGGLSAFSLPWMAIVAAGITVVAPLGLGLRGRTSKLAWTRRLKTLAVVAGVVDVVLFTLAAVTSVGPPLAALLCFLQPAILDLMLLVTGPFERRAAKRFVRSAEQKLRAAHPTTVAITGSYGKTTTKVYLRHLAGGTREVLASPASFNNTGGLSRTLNEQLSPATEVFVAEMGTYGPGEIRSMCSWVQPDVAAIVNIGPVHLERMKTLDRIVRAKAEIFELEVTRACVLNVDAHGLAKEADRLQAGGKRVVRVSASPAMTGMSDVTVLADEDGALDVWVQGAHRHRIPPSAAQPANVAAALGLVLALDIEVADVLPRLDSLPDSEHRQQVVTAPSGVLVVDNTFSSNPASAAASLALLDRVAPPGGRAVLVTPGMVELGREQFDENRKLATDADEVCTDLVIVGTTNRKALLAGSANRDLTVHLAAQRDQAVEWVRANLREGDAVLYENDLPDHYPQKVGSVARPAVIFGGASPEHDISILTGLQAARALHDGGLDPIGIYWSKGGDFHQVPATLEAKDYVNGVPAKAERLDLIARPAGGFVAEKGRFGKRAELEITAAVNCCHGGAGEDGTLQAALDLAGVRYTGPGAAGAALGMDKLAFGGAMSAAGLPTLPRFALSADGPDPSFAGPYILKPRFGGSSIGIEITDDLTTARALVRSSPHHRDGAVLEPYLPDSVDLNVSVRTWPALTVSAVEKPLRKEGSNRIYTYAEKYLGGGEGLSSAPRELPALLPDEITDRLRALATQVAAVALVRGAPRIDFLWHGDDLWVNEINTIPGALAWYFWQAEGVAFRQLLTDLLDEAVRGPVRSRTTEGADGSALRAAGSIAGKLA